jgi:hypothetical protein
MFFLILTDFLFFPVSAFAEEVIEIDQTAPVLSYTPKSESIESGKPLEISAQATDNQRVAKVTLFYRRNGEGEYQSAEMVNTDHDHYSYLIPGEEVHGEKLEYYLTAEDEAGNRTMKGFSATPLRFNIVSGAASAFKKSKSFSSSSSSMHPVLFKSSYSKDSLELYLGESTFRLSDQGNQMNVPAFSYGVEGQFQYQPDYEIDIGVNGSHADSIKINWVVFQNLSGTLYESLDVLSVYAGQRIRRKNISFLIALNDMTARVSDRNLLNTSGFRITRFPDENYNQVGITLGFGWNYPVTEHFEVGVDPKINLFFSGQLNNFTFPIEIRYEF